ncbi:hypothetical protein FAIPA1_40296 [Frankia sp. AiPs1]
MTPASRTSPSTPTTRQVSSPPRRPRSGRSRPPRPERSGPDLVEDAILVEEGDVVLPVHVAQGEVGLDLRQRGRQGAEGLAELVGVTPEPHGPQRRALILWLRLKFALKPAGDGLFDSIGTSPPDISVGQRGTSTGSLLSRGVVAA